MLKLSILICSLCCRLTDLAALAANLEQQVCKAEKERGETRKDNKPVEILWLGDNSTMSVGEKRNKLLQMSKGEYVCFVDDDDWVENDYIEQLLKGIERNPDVVCFDVGFCNAELGGDEITAHFSIGNVFNQNFSNRRNRMPNHLMAVKRQHALKVGFTEKSFGEDTDYGLRLRGKSKAEALLKTEYHCGKVLYHYRFDPKKSATHHLNPEHRIQNPESWRQEAAMIKIDVVMVSDATILPPSETTTGCERSSRGASMTQRAINSIVCPKGTAGRAADDVNIIVLEKDTHVRYAHADTFLQKQPFNYNQCLNYGAAFGNAEFIIFTNNDVLFPEGFVEQILEECRSCIDLISVSNQHGFSHKDIISGFCFVMRRSAWLKIGKLNTDYPFWCADNVTAEQVKKHGLKEYKSAIKVTHFTSVSLKKLDSTTREAYTRGCVKQFNKDYKQNVLGMGK